MDNVTDIRSDLKIKRIWFQSERIFMESEDGEVYSRPLEAFPSLKNATVSQRENYEIGKWGDDIRWPAIDEDIHVSSFLDRSEPDPDNEIAEIFSHFPELNVSQVAKRVGISKNLLFKYIYGIKKPSAERRAALKETLRLLGKELMAV